MNKIEYFDAGVITPEEIFIAADLVPIRLLGDPTISIDKANEHIPPTHCFWARNLLEQAINGLKDVKGIIATHGCDCTNRQFDTNSCNLYDLKRKLGDDYDIPCLILDADMNDPRKLNETQTINKIESFIEILEERKKN